MNSMTLVEAITAFDEGKVGEVLTIRDGIHASYSSNRYNEIREVGLQNLTLLALDLASKKAEHVKELDLSGVKLGARGAEIIAEMLSKNTTLEKLTVIGCRLGSGHDWDKPVDSLTGFQILTAALREHRSVTTVIGLNDAGNWLRPKEKALGDTFGKYSQSLYSQLLNSQLRDD